MEFSLKIMGTASAMPVVGKNQSAHVLQVRGRSFLIDCGEGVQQQMLRYGVSLMKLDAVLVSHIHGDHIFGLLPLLSTLGLKGRTAPLPLYAPANCGPILRFFLSFFGEGLPYEILFQPLTMKEPTVVHHTKSLEILAFPLNHKIDTYGFLIREKEPPLNIDKQALAACGFSLSEIGALKRGEDIVRTAPDGTQTCIPCEEVTYKPYIPRSYAYCSDTAPFPELAGWVRGVDLLYHETTYLQERADQAQKRYHSTTLDAARCALEACAGRLVIGHYSSRESDLSLYERECRTVFPATYAAREGDVFDVPLKTDAKNSYIAG